MQSFSSSSMYMRCDKPFTHRLFYNLYRQIPGDDPSVASSITVKQFASLSKIKFKIPDNSPQRERPIHPGERIHDSDELLQSNGTILLHGRREKDDIKEQKIKELKRLNSLPPTLPEKREDSPHESEPDVWFSHFAFLLLEFYLMFDSYL